MIRKIRSSTHFDKCRFVVGGTSSQVKSGSRNLLSFDSKVNVAITSQKRHNNVANVAITSQKRFNNDTRVAVTSQKRCNNDTSVAITSQKRFNYHIKEKIVSISEQCSNNDDKSIVPITSQKRHSNYMIETVASKSQQNRNSDVNADDATKSHRRRYNDVYVEVPTTLIQRRIIDIKETTFNINRQTKNLENAEGVKNSAKLNSEIMMKEDSEREIEEDKIYSCSGPISVGR